MHRPYAYLDTSVLVAAHVAEPWTALTQNWLSAHSGKMWVMSEWAWVECESALAIKVRRGEIDVFQQAQAMSDINTFRDRLTTVVVPLAVDYQRARELCRPAMSGLRAGDALHLAVALRSGVQRLATLDRLLADNAVAHGLLLAIALP